MARAYSYVRFSTLEQRKGGSENRQVELSRSYVRNHPNLELDESLRFSDLGVSAFDKSNLAKGAALRTFLDAIDKGVVARGSYLLVESLDRLSRAQISDALEIFMGILNRGITVVTLADGMEYSKEKANKQFTDLIISITIMSRTHEESLTKSKRLKAAWKSKRANIGARKLTRNCPSWLTQNADATAYRFIPAKVTVVRKMIRLVMSGVGKDAIAKRFNRDGIRSLGTRSKEGTWYGSYVSKILNSRALIGEFQPHEEIDGKLLAAT